jgi:thioredoxin reductase (NADPH)
MFLAEQADSPVTVIIRGPDLGANMSRYLVERIEANPKIRVLTNARITGVDGDRSLASARVTTPGGDTTLPCAALFSFIGAEPSAGWLSRCAALDDRGFVLTDLSLGEEHLDQRWALLGRRPLPFETSHPGLFAAGYVRSGSTKRVAAAVGEGSASVRSVHEHLSYAH